MQTVFYYIMYVDIYVYTWIQQTLHIQSIYSLGILKAVDFINWGVQYYENLLMKD